MKLRALRLWNVKKFAGTGIAIENIGDDINVLAAPNEDGKSTCFEALYAAFFSPHGSTAGQVKKLRPYSGGNPRIQVDVERIGELFRIDKTFYSRGNVTVTKMPSGQVVAQGDVAENWIKECVGDNQSGPAGLIWVRQGDQEINRNSEGRRSLLSSVESEVDAVTGGQRMDDALAYCKSAIGQWRTDTGRVRQNSDYDLALKEHDQLAQARDEMGAKVRALAESLDKRRRAQRRLAELERPEEQTRIEQEKADAQRAVDEAEEYSRNLETARTQKALAEVEATATEERLTTFTERSARLAELIEMESLASQALTESASTKDEVIAAESVARQKLEEAKKAESDALIIQRKVDAFDRAESARAAFEEKRDALEKADRAKQEIEEFKGQIAALKVDSDDLDRLDEIESELSTLDARREARQGQVTVEYGDNAKGRIRHGQKALEDATPLGVNQHIRLDVDDIGSISFTLGESDIDEIDASIKAFEEERQEILTKHDCQTVGELLQRQTKAGGLEGESSSRTARLDALAPQGLDQLRAEVESLRLQQNDETGEDLPSAEDAQRYFDETRAGREEAESSERQAVQASSEAKQDESEKRASLESIQSEKSKLEEMLGPEDRRAATKEELEADNQEKQQNLGDAVSNFESLNEAAPDLDTLRGTLQRCSQIVENSQTEASELRIEISEINGLLNNVHTDAIEEELEEIGERLERAERRVATFEREIAVLKRLQQALEAARSSAKETFLAPIAQELQPLLRILFDEASLEFDGDSLLPDRLIRPGVAETGPGEGENMDNLSGGTREQLTILTRLAFARLAQRQGASAPVILDDALIYSDDDRIEKMFDAIQRQAKDLQIIAFTCRQRAFSRLGGNKLEMTSWNPDS